MKHLTRAVRNRALFAIGGVWLAIADPGRASAEVAECSNAALAPRCVSNADCACGQRVASEQCDVAVPACVTPAANCQRFCQGWDFSLAPICHDGRCGRARRSGCIGDCDVDLAVGVDELITGVGIALGEQPLAACVSFDGDFDGDVAVDEIVQGARAGLAGCAAAARPDAAVDAIYDVSVALNGDQGSMHGVGESRDNSASTRYLSVWFGNNLSFMLNLGRNTEGSWQVDGYYILTDYGTPVIGSATITDSATAEVIEAHLAPGSAGGFFTTADFVMQRSKPSEAQRFSGRYHVTLTNSPRGNNLPSAVDLSLDVAPTGEGFSSHELEVGADDEVFGTVTAGKCLVASGGSLFCRAFYLVEGTAQAAPLLLGGVLVDEPASGQGTFFAGVDPPFYQDPYVHGLWTAVKLPR